MELSNIMKVKYLFVMILVFFACGNRQKIVEELSQLQSKSIILPQQSRFTIQGKDTVSLIRRNVLLVPLIKCFYGII